MEHIKIITVFKNKEGEHDYDFGRGHESENVIRFGITESELYEIAEKNFFLLVNERCNLMIDDCETEILDAASVEQCYRIYNMLGLSKESELYKAICQAKDFGFGLALDF